MSKPSVFIVTANGCSACDRFKSRIDESLMDKLYKDNRVQVYRINLSSMSEPLPSTYPKELNKYIMWYPTFIIMFPNGRVAVFNGEVTESKLSGPFNDRPISEQSILAWINEEVTNNASQRKITSNRLYKPYGI